MPEVMHIAHIHDPWTRIEKKSKTHSRWLGGSKFLLMSSNSDWYIKQEIKLHEFMPLTIEATRTITMQEKTRTLQGFTSSLSHINSIWNFKTCFFFLASVCECVMRSKRWLHAWTRQMIEVSRIPRFSPSY